GGQADVLTLAVAADGWGEGIGGALLDGLLTEAARRGCTEVFLEVRVDNDRAQRLYRGRGFIDIGIRRGYYQPSGTDALVMRRISEAPPGARKRHLAGRHRGRRGKRRSRWSWGSRPRVTRRAPARGAGPSASPARAPPAGPGTPRFGRACPRWQAGRTWRPWSPPWTGRWPRPG